MGMIVGLLNNSATWLMRIHFKSSAKNASCLVSLVTHLNWSGFLEKFLVSSDLQQFNVKSNVNTRELKWQATAEYIQKIVFISCFNRANDGAKFDYCTTYCVYGMMTWI